MARYSYQTQPLLTILLPFVFMAGIAVFIPFVAIAQQKWDGLIFFVIWLVVGGFVGSQLLWSISYRLELEGETLRWFTPFRHGEVSVAELVSITTSLSGRLAVFELDGQEDIQIPVRVGLPEFAELVAGDRAIPVDVSVPLGRRYGASHFSRD